MIAREQRGLCVQSSAEIHENSAPSVTQRSPSFHIASVVRSFHCKPGSRMSSRPYRMPADLTAVLCMLVQPCILWDFDPLWGAPPSCCTGNMEMTAARLSVIGTGGYLWDPGSAVPQQMPFQGSSRRPGRLTEARRHDCVLRTRPDLVGFQCKLILAKRG
jgi:hypothetical protein